MNANDITIELRYDDDFRKAVVEHGRPDPLVGAKVRVGDSYVFGDEGHVNSDYMCTNLTIQLEATEQILADEKVVVEYANGPMWLVFEPHDEEMVKITGCATIEGVRDPSERLSVDRSALVSKTALIAELVETAGEFHGKVVELNPELENDQFLQRLREAIAEAQERLEMLNNE